MKLQKTINIQNRKASFEYYFLEEYSAGMVLTGTEIKSIREGKVSMADAYCFFDKGELYVKNMNISKINFFKTTCLLIFPSVSIINAKSNSTIGTTYPYIIFI